MLQFHLRPTKRLDCASLLRLTPDVYVQECLDVDGFAPALDELKERMAQLAADPNRCTDQYPKVFFFGTGSQIPSKTRNTSAILVEIESVLPLFLLFSPFTPFHYCCRVKSQDLRYERASGSHVKK